MEGQIGLFDQDTWCGKTSPEHSAVMAGETSKPYSKKRSGLRMRKLPLFLCLQKGDGAVPDVCGTWVEDGALRGEFSMHSFGEYPNEENASRLSQILEDCPPRKYYLSAKACQGILRRAEKRGKELPPELKAALEVQANAPDLSIPPERGDIGYEPELSPTLIAGQVHAVLNMPKAYCIAGNTIGREIKNGGNGTGVNEEVSYTLNTTDRHVVFDARGNGDGRISPTITGGHNSSISDYTAVVVEQNRAGAIADMDSKAYGIGNGQTNQGFDVELVGALNCMHDQQAVMVTGPYHDTVRRLTPLECERLQGYPDGWTDIGTWTDTKGKTHETSDAARYKALGNSIALPPWTWVLKRICACYERSATMASLFDGIGGFSLIWERLNGKGTCLWASEIEEFPIAVTKRRINESE